MTWISELNEGESVGFHEGAYPEIMVYEETKQGDEMVLGSKDCREFVIPLCGVCRGLFSATKDVVLDTIDENGYLKDGDELKVTLEKFKQPEQ